MTPSTNEDIGGGGRVERTAPPAGVERDQPTDGGSEAISLGANPRFLTLIERARAQRRAGAGLTTDEVRRELGLN